jgi:hypothetical protein
MNVKCAITGKKIETTFLKKPLGISIRHKGKVYWISSEAQKQFGNDREKIIAELNV